MPLAVTMVAAEDLEDIEEGQMGSAAKMVLAREVVRCRGYILYN